MKKCGAVAGLVFVFVCVFAVFVHGHGGQNGEPTMVVLTEFIVDTSAILAPDELDAVLSNYLHREMTLDELDEMLDDLNDLYRQKGYLATALLPEQFVDDGVVHLRLVEGRIGNIAVAGNRHTRSAFIGSRLGVAAGDLVSLDGIEAGLMTFNDTYDVQLQAELQAGESFGTSDVVVHVIEPDNNEYSLWADSGGREEFGLARYGLTWLNRSLFGIRDALTLSLTSGGASQSAAATYSVPVSRGGTRVAVDHSYNHIDVVEGDFHDVDIAGDSKVTGMTVVIPFVNQRSDRFGVSVAHRQIQSNTYFEGHKLTGYTLATWRLGLSAHVARPGSPKRWSYAYNFVSGEDSIVKIPFAKHTLAGSFQHVLRNATALEVTLSGQVADTELLPEAEQFMLGGMSTVRGYRSGYLTGDEGYLVNVKWEGAMKSGVQWALYVDHGGVFPYKGNEEPLGPEDYVTSGAIGLQGQMWNHLHGQILWGTPLDREGESVFYVRMQLDW